MGLGFVEEFSTKSISLLEKFDGVDRLISAMVDFRLVLSDCDLMDIRFSGSSVIKSDQIFFLRRLQMLVSSPNRTIGLLL